MADVPGGPADPARYARVARSGVPAWLGIPPDVLRPAVRVLAAHWLLGPNVPWPKSRARLEQALTVPLPPRGTRATPLELGGVPGLEVRSPGAAADRVILYVHGGGYVVGSARMYRALSAQIGRGARARVCVLDYRMGPEHPFPAAGEDVLTAYRALLDQGTDPARIAVAGDSAGGAASLVLAMQARAAGLPLPAVLGLICPWGDARGDLSGARVSAPREPLLTAPLLRRFALGYAEGHDGSDPALSPVLGDFTGLPPIVIQSGGDDLLLPDAIEIESRARAASVAVEHRRFDGLWHDFHLFGPFLAGPGRDASRLLGEAIGARLA